MGATYAVGDIQGCHEPLRRLLDKAGFDPGQDRLWCVGDLVNRGPKSLKTLRFLKSLGKSCIAVLGNHDLHLLALASGVPCREKKDHLQAVLAAPDCAELCGWLRRLPLVHLEKLETTQGRQTFLMVHAGIAPGWSFKQARKLGQEVEAALQGGECKKFLSRMYGDEPDIWHDELTGMERLRVITNYLTRVRFCNAETQLNLAVKTGPATAPKGFKPWYEYQRLPARKAIIFGHWATLDGKADWPNVYAMDTGCVWGKCLSLLRLEDKKLFRVDCG